MTKKELLQFIKNNIQEIESYMDDLNVRQLRNVLKEHFDIHPKTTTKPLGISKSVFYDATNIFIDNRLAKNTKDIKKDKSLVKFEDKNVMQSDEFIALLEKEGQNYFNKMFENSIARKLIRADIIRADINRLNAKLEKILNNNKKGTGFFFLWLTLLTIIIILYGIL